MLHKVVARENVSFPDMESTTLGTFIHNSLPFLMSIFVGIILHNAHTKLMSQILFRKKVRLAHETRQVHQYMVVVVAG